MDDDAPLVYSTDPKFGQQAQRNRKVQKPKQANAVKGDFTAKLRIEKAGRKGKIVTVIDELPNFESYLKPLSKELKSKCGSGGTFVLGPRFGCIEIQGDKREMLREILKQKGILFKG